MDISRFCFLLFLQLVAAESLQAQLTWKNVDEQFAPLPPGIHAFFTNDSLDDAPNRAYYVSIPLKNKDIEFAVDTGKLRRFTPTQYFERNDKPLVVVNTTFFSPDSRNLNVVISKGKLLANNTPSVYDKSDSLYHYVTRSAIGISKKGTAEVVWAYTDTLRKMAFQSSNSLAGSGRERYPSVAALNKAGFCQGCLMRWKTWTAVGGGPNLLSNGTILVTNNEERIFAGSRIGEKHPRTAMGYSLDGHLIILVVEGRFPGKAEGATLHQLAAMLKEAGCAEALNLDGGGSSCMLINGQETITPSDKTGQRPVPAVFLVKRKRLQ